MRVWSRTASLSELRQRLRVRRSRPSPERTIRARPPVGEGIVPQAGLVELVEDERLGDLRAQAWQDRRVGDAGADFLVDEQRQSSQERRLADEHEIVGAGEVLAEQAQFAQAIGGHEVGIVDNGHEHFAGPIDAEGFLDQQAFAVTVEALELDLECLAEDAQGVVLRSKRTCTVRSGRWRDASKRTAWKEKALSART